MRIRLKICISVLLIWILMISITYFVSLKILDNGYLSLEQQQIGDTVERVNDAISSMLTNNDVFLKAWSNWDELYHYAADKNVQFAQNNLLPDSVAAYNLDLFLMYDQSGIPIFTKSLNDAHNQFVSIPINIVSLFKPGGLLRKLVVLPETGHDVTGFVLTSRNNILAFASRRILPTTGTGTANGTIIFGRYLNADAWKKIANTAKLNMALYILSAEKKDSEINLIAQSLQDTSYIFSKVNSNRAYLYTTLKDYKGNPVAVVKTEFKRAIHYSGNIALKSINRIFIIAGTIFSIVMFFLIYLFLIKRLEKMSYLLDKINKQKEYTHRLPDNGFDEISYIGSQGNRVLNAVESFEKISLGVINAMDVPFVMIDQNMNITVVNKKAEIMLNSKLNKMKDKSVYEYIPYLKEYENKISSSLESRIAREITQITYSTQSNIFYFNIYLYPLNQFGKECLGIVIDDVSIQIKTEQRLLKNDKLASIGLLTAGVAHEINNPINYIAGSSEPIKRNLNDIFSILNKYAEIKDVGGLSEKLNEINAYKKEIDIDYTIDETRRLIAGIKDGASRTATIVKDLKLFSQFDEEEKIPANIHAGLDSTLTLLQHNYKDRIQIVKNYADNLPEIDCYIGKLNQVFMNIISNAIDAIPDKGQITIKTSQVGDDIQIEITDTGSGMSAETISKIFDPFFTTKGQGKGTGLGLQICASIVQSHGGVIEVKSTEGKGTSFIITLPLHQHEVS